MSTCGGGFRGKKKGDKKPKLKSWEFRTFEAGKRIG